MKKSSCVVARLAVVSGLGRWFNDTMNASQHATSLRRRIRFMVWVFIIGLVVSGVTAIPLQWEMNLAARLLGGDEARTASGLTVEIDFSKLKVVTEDHAAGGGGLTGWVVRVRDGLNDTYAKYPFIAYGTDWLAFGHLMIALVFVGALRDPVRNAWLFDFAMIACVLVVPFALIFGGVRGIPFYWRLIDCSFGVFGIIPVWLCRNWVQELQQADEAGHVSA